MKNEILAFDDADINTMSKFFFNLGAGKASPYAVPRCVHCGEEIDEEQTDVCDECLRTLYDR